MLITRYKKKMRNIFRNLQSIRQWER